ncbi:MAG: hypothetical protein QNK15_07330 [Cycloclasticus sp.]|nr:hypothetical protein [Cycloclasticus sp.]
MVESFAGPHDFLDGILYDRDNGYTLDLGVFAPVGLVYSIATIPVAVPFAIAPYIDNPHIGYARQNKK